jgi:chorismate mutase/prephenate dehydratase
MFVVRDRVGALYRSLRPFYRHRISLTFIESRPSRRRNWEYHFFVDFLGHAADPAPRQALDELATHCQFIRILGSYPRAAGSSR